MADASFDYSFEYQGLAQKLVHTPLTHKCYITLTQGNDFPLDHNVLSLHLCKKLNSAMKMGLGGNPYGPAGTGKTESVKALANILGRQVLVFNCDEVSTYVSLQL